MRCWGENWGTKGGGENWLLKNPNQIPAKKLRIPSERRNVAAHESFLQSERKELLNGPLRLESDRQNYSTSPGGKALINR